MKNFRLLATSLLVALCAGFSSCGNDDIKDMSPTYEYKNPICEEYGIVDYKNIEGLTIFQGRQMNFSGLRNNKLWLASFSVEDKSVIINWTDELPFNRTRRIHSGYGEYTDVTIFKILLLQVIPFKQDFVALLEYDYSVIFFKTIPYFLNKEYKLKKFKLIHHRWICGMRTLLYAVNAVIHRVATLFILQKKDF